MQKIISGMLPEFISPAFLLHRPDSREDEPSREILRGFAGQHPREGLPNRKECRLYTEHSKYYCLAPHVTYSRVGHISMASEYWGAALSYADNIAIGFFFFFFPASSMTVQSDGFLRHTTGRSRLWWSMQ